jgi:hypothetical protein
MKSIKELEKDYDLILSDLSVRILSQIKRIGGLKQAEEKSKLSAMQLNYSINTDNFKTKIRMLTKLEAIK